MMSQKVDLLLRVPDETEFILWTQALDGAKKLAAFVSQPNEHLIIAGDVSAMHFPPVTQGLHEFNLEFQRPDTVDPHRIQSAGLILEGVLVQPLKTNRPLVSSNQ